MLWYVPYSLDVQMKGLPVTAERTKAEVEAMKLGPMEGGRELKETRKVILGMKY